MLHIDKFEYLRLISTLLQKLRADTVGDKRRQDVYKRQRVSRALLHLILDIQESDICRFKASGYAPYARIRCV